jgi:hypothetical protein
MHFLLKAFAEQNSPCGVFPIRMPILRYIGGNSGKRYKKSIVLVQKFKVKDKQQANDNLYTVKRKVSLSWSSGF